MSYGIPYMGSKNAIANKILNVLPSSDVFVDIFAGGCAMTHAAMLSGKYKSFLMNDISGTTQLFMDAVNGNFANETRWISRDVFDKEKNNSLYIKYVWSFGNCGKQYLYGEHVEEWKHALWNAKVFGDMEMLRDMGIMGDVSVKDINSHGEEYKRKYIRWFYEKKHMPVPTDEQMRKTDELVGQSEDMLRGMLCNALRVHGVSQAQVCKFLGNQMARHYFGKSQWEFPTPENYERLRVLLPTLPEIDGYEEYATYRSLHRLQRLQRLQMDYADVPLPSRGAVIYADPPYRGTEQYGDIIFDHERFYDWCERQTLPLFISEYSMPNSRFKCVAEFQHTNKMSAKGSTRNVERLFVPIHQRFCQPKQLELC